MVTAEPVGTAWTYPTVIADADELLPTVACLESFSRRLLPSEFPSMSSTFVIKCAQSVTSDRLGDQPMKYRPTRDVLP